jgi:hypothetical protein
MNIKLRKAITIFVALSLLVLLSPAGWVLASRAEQSASSNKSSIYLPYIPNQASPLPFIGLESYKLSYLSMVDKVNAARGAWVRIDTISWEKIEPEQPLTTTVPHYLWDTVDEEAIALTAGRNLKVIATIKYTPSWAQQVPGSVCGPIAPDRLDEFARFLDALVRRYSAPPYYVKYWQLGNEPDVAVSTALKNYGCWGDPADLEYFGGDDYATMLKVAYPAIKAADPQAQVLIGGLLLDCDPTANSNCITGKFFDGILANGGADYFDIVAYHAYPFFHIPINPVYTNRIHDLDHPNWTHREGRGIILGKADFLRERMAAYAVDKPLIMTETALVCPGWGNGCCNSGQSQEACEKKPAPVDEFYEKQADFVVSVYTRNAANDLLGTVWYTLEDPGWRAAGLHDKKIPTQGYYALEAMGNLLYPTQYFGPVNEYTAQNITGLEFRAATYRIWVLWSRLELDTSIALPAGIQQVYDKYGVAIPFSNNELTINSPVYLKISLP